MAPLVRRRGLMVSAAVVVLLGAAFAGASALKHFARGRDSGETVLEKLDVYGLVPEFSLMERNGRPVTLRDLRGKAWVANFIYTECTQTCPLQSLEVASLQREFATTADLRLVSITVDPKHDTAEVLRAYAERYGADRERWLFLTGEKREIYCLATGLRLSVVDPADPSPPACGRPAAGRAVRQVLAWLTPPPALATHGSKGLITHSARLVVIDRAGRVRAYHLATDEDSLKRHRANLQEILAEHRGGS